MRIFKRITALIVTLVMGLSACPFSVTAEGMLSKPEKAPDFSTYTKMDGIAFTSEVADLPNGSKYIDYWNGKAYSFTVGVNIFGSFEDACAVSAAEVPSVFVLPGNQGELLITAPVNVYGYYYDVNPNAPMVDAAACPARNPERDAGMETIFSCISVKEGTLGSVYVGGFTLAGSFFDSERGISDQATEITLENVVVSQDSAASPNTSHIFIVSNANASNTAESAAQNKDSFTLRNCRLEKVISQRISSNQIPQKYTVDGMVSVSGCTTFYGFPQWRRYIKNGEFTLQNCYFEDFAAADGRGYFLVMEGLNKFNGNCTIDIKNNVFGGNAANYMMRIFTKVGYDINITDNTFLAKSKSGLIPITWDTSYDTNLYSDYADNADISKVDLSTVAEIRNNRFIGYTKFDKVINSQTVLNLNDNFFTTDLSGYKTAVGTAPTYNDGWKLSRYWVDYALSVGSETIPAISFSHAAVQQTEGGFSLHTNSAAVNLYDFGLQLPKGVTVQFSTDESYSSIALKAGSNTRTFTVYSYDGSASKAYTLTIYYDAVQTDAIERLQAAYVRLNAGCYTDASVKGYADVIETLRRAIEQNGDVAAALAALDAAEAALVYKPYIASVDLRYYDLFTNLNSYTVSDTAGWKKFASLVGSGTELFGGKTVTLTAPLNFGGATIDPVGGCFETDAASDNVSFKGTFDGGCHMIENFVINKPDHYGVGLFGRAVGATIKNVRIGKATVTGYDKLGGLAGFADNCTVSNCSSEATVVAVSGRNGVGGLVSQARSKTKMTDCINYGSVTSPEGRANGVMSWGQTTAVLTRCVNYGTLSGDDNSYPVGRWDESLSDWSPLMNDCYYTSSSIAQIGADVLEDLNVYELAWTTGLYVENGRLSIKNVGKKVYRIALNCGNLGVRYYYGAAGEQVNFNVPGYYVNEVLNGTQVLSVAELTYTRDCNYTATMTPYNYTVNYELNGGSFINDVVDVFNVENDFALPGGSMIEKSGYLFAGWYQNPDFSGNRVASVEKGTAKDITVYAKYVKVDYEISTAAQLVSLANTVNNGNNLAGKGVKLTADIDVSGVSFAGIGNSMLTPFAGVFDGAGHRISGLKISGVPVAGVVGVLTNSGMVSNLLAEGSVSGNLAGGIVGNNLGGSVETCSFNGTVTSAPTVVKLVSQNVRVDSSSDLHGAKDRHTPLKNILLAQDPDVIGFQECTMIWKAYLTQDFSNYGYVWQYRGYGSNTLTKGLEATPVFYKKSKFDLLDSGTFWLSDTPNKASLCFNEDMNRICTWVKLRVKTTGEIFFFFNTHFPLDDESRVKSVAVLKSKVASLAGNYNTYFLTADWNCTDGSSGYKALVEWNEDMSYTAKVDATNNSGTYNGFKVTPGSRIDIAFGRPNTVTVPYYKVILDTYTDANGEICPPSDHYGVYYEVELQSGAGGVAGNNEGAIYECVSQSNGSAGTFFGSACAKNFGYVDGLYYGDQSCGLNLGTDKTFTQDTLAAGLYQMNDNMGLNVWGIEDGKAVLQPRGDRIYRIEYLDFEGNVGKTDFNTLAAAKEWYPDYDDAATVFNYWDYTVFGNVATFVPVMQASAYTVKFYGFNGDVLKTQVVTYGEAATAPQAPAVEGYSFMGWDQNFTEVKGNLDVKAVYIKENTFDLTLLTEGEATTLTVNGEAVTSGFSCSALGGTHYKIRAGEGFLYWKDAAGKIYSENAVLDLVLTHHMTLTAVYATAKRYTVTFADIDGTVLETQVVVRSAYGPAEPERPGMTFAGWDQSYRGLKGDVIIRATYTAADTATVTVEGGSASAETVTLGESVTVTPNQTEGFMGWSTDGKTIFSTKAELTLPVWGDITLKALYEDGKHCGVAIAVYDDNTVQLIRRVEGDYTVLSSGILYADSLAASLVPECATVTTVQQQVDYTLTRNGSAIFTVENAVYLRGYVVLLDEMTGETVVQYTAVYMKQQ